MEQLDLTSELLADPARLLALDEVALEFTEATGRELVWFWESTRSWVVIGLGQAIALEANLEACEQERVPVYRRCSGGGAVIQGPGCLNYAVTLRLDRDSALSQVTSTNSWVMERLRQGIQRQSSAEIAVQGHTDLSFRDGSVWRKFSGNAQRRRRSALLFHGTLLHAFDLSRIATCLRHPSAEPGYRAGRTHLEFVANLPVGGEVLRTALRESWSPQGTSADFPWAKVTRLADERYRTDVWNRRR